MHSDAVHNLWVLIPISGVNNSEFKHLLKLPIQGTGQFVSIFIPNSKQQINAPFQWN